ncbi:MAG: ribosome maturation factor RimM [Nitrospirota bacterium]|nr:ribosome maturation factor RimM [Nitrospirota bacterium]
MRTGDSGIDHAVDSGFVSIGYIAKTIGLKGDVKVIPLTDAPDRYTNLKKVMIQKRSGERKEYSLKGVRAVRGGLRISFTPAISVSEAEEIVGGYITVPEKEVPGLAKDCYYHFEIMDMEVYTGDGRYLGRITDILSTGSNDVYVVRDQNNKEYMIPAIHEVVKEVDTKAKRMIISVMEGLL